MQIGDLLVWQDKRWLALVQDRVAKLTTLLSEDGTRVGAPTLLDRRRDKPCAILCNPARDWPCIMHKAKKRYGKLLAVQRTLL
jgi:hypothetical protein